METTLDILKAVSDKNRLRVVAALSRYDELCACQITELLEVSGATVSRHLGILQKAGLLDSRKDGRWVYFKLARPTGTDPFFQWLETTFAGSSELRADLEALEKIVGITREDLCRQQRGEACCPK
ncbi:Arsenic resistance transcriptional regulator ArsR1 [Pontiella desulfatans]|uniref:Arsenic resistance transcriptional regulator ArsR1 n=1 Tax=Pontiella desulfatans TaxID=2750659 RepID=A0A6C2UBS7_PONDE|nr:metalloregulator ArsR/SmtB family transcription factor [Pontiella desulfatans]VGO17389.1 Arsenic resistance transcriptional regulator ArsR1 [Pontiella desulfatans]